jgi:stage II sporulation protein R
MKKRTYLWLSIICLLLVFGYSWYHLQAEDRSTIPQQAIRLRILANSDSAQDQWLKRKVRDRIVQEINSWAEQPKNIAEARQLIKKRLPRLQRLSEQTVAKAGFDYPVKLQFGNVPFPTKLYGEKVYPAGMYEAVLIKIGRAQGDNWWCVLFPPLCFVDMKNGDAVPSVQTDQAFSSSIHQNQAYAASLSQQSEPKEEKKPEVRFLLFDLLKKR